MKKHDGLLFKFRDGQIADVEVAQVGHTDDQPCPLRVCDEVIYESPEAKSVGYSRAYAANWDKTFGAN